MMIYSVALCRRPLPPQPVSSLPVQEIKVIEKRVEESRVALQHLEMHLINTACDDPGATIGMQLALPVLQDRLDARALEHKAELAKMAESEIIRMEVRGGCTRGEGI